MVAGGGGGARGAPARAAQGLQGRGGEGAGRCRGPDGGPDGVEIECAYHDIKRSQRRGEKQIRAAVDF